MNTIITGLIEFVKAAKKSRKYVSESAEGIIRVLTLIEPELNEEESSSLDVLEKNIDSIFQEFYRKNQTRYTISSVETYKKRVKRAISDFKTYGFEKMNQWDVVLKTRNRKAKSTVHLGDKPESVSLEPIAEAQQNVIKGGNRIEYPLENGDKATIVLPPRLLSQLESEKIKKIIEIYTN